jgi:hypothetical protein
MWRRTALIVVIGLALASRSRSMAQESQCPQLLISDLNWVRFDVVMGRIVAVKNRAKQDRQRARRELPCGTCEALTISIDRGLTSLHYVLESERLDLTVHVSRRDDVEIRYERRERGTQPVDVLYSQVPGETVRVAVSRAGESQVVHEAASFWHVVVCDPDACDYFLIDVLKELNPDWRPMVDAEAIRTKLLKTSQWELNTSLDEVQMLVDQLGDRNFKVRQLADRELRSRGRSVLGLLECLDSRKFDSEQRMRIREIRRALVQQHSDTPDRVAAWLVNERCIWLRLMHHADARCRAVAQTHLARLVDRPVDFDPYGAPKSRSEQLASLEDQLTRR